MEKNGFKINWIDGNLALEEKVELIKSSLRVKWNGTKQSHFNKKIASFNFVNTSTGSVWQNLDSQWRKRKTMHNFVTYNSSAGSGKTYTLVKEYLKIALETENPNQY